MEKDNRTEPNTHSNDFRILRENQCLGSGSVGSARF